MLVIKPRCDPRLVFMNIRHFISANSTHKKKIPIVVTADIRV